MTQSKNIESAVKFIAGELGDVDDFRIDYSTMQNGKTYITIHCDQPIKDVNQSYLNKYKLESIELGQSTTYTLTPQEI
jgi:hypothetical protein